MTTSSQPSPLSVRELDALRRCALDPHAVDATLRGELAAKGMLQSESGDLTPAGQHALHVNADDPLPGLDN